MRTAHQAVHAFNQAHSLLKAAAAWHDHQSGEALRISYRTALTTRHRFCEEGLAAARYPKKARGAPKKYPGKVEAFSVATAGGPAPQGYGQSSWRWLASQLGELGLGETISPPTVRTMLK